VGRLARNPIAQGVPWEVKLVREQADETANATFALHNGSIYVFTGILDAVERQEDRVAFLLAHEMAHIVFLHVAVRTRRSASRNNAHAAGAPIGSCSHSTCIALAWHAHMHARTHLHTHTHTYSTCTRTHTAHAHARWLNSLELPAPAEQLCTLAQHTRRLGRRPP